MAFCSGLLFFALSTISVSGVLFYGIVEAFGVTRQEASWPVTLSVSLLPLAGPVTGLLCRLYSCRKVLLVCSAVTGTAVSLCYFARDILFIVIFFGVIHGVTLSALYVGVNVLVAQHFDRRRTLACSLMFTIGGLNNFTVPPLIEWFRTTYGIRGAFLLYGAILLNGIPFSIALRSPMQLRASTNPVSEKRKSFDRDTDSKKFASLMSGAEGDGSCEDEGTKNEQLFSASGGLENGAATDCNVHSDTCVHTRHPMKSCFKANHLMKLKDTVKPFMTLAFCVSAVSFSVVNFGMALFTLLSTDLAADRGIQPSDSVFLLQAFSVGDIIFRPLAGVAINSNILTLELVMLLGFIVQGAAFELLACFRPLYAMLAASALIGTTCGSRIAIQTPVLVKDFGVERLPVMIGGLLFCVGVALLLRPPFLGYFRDNLGSYAGVLHTMAAVNALLSVVWAVKLLSNRRKRGFEKEPSQSSKDVTVSKKLLDPTDGTADTPK